MYPYSNSEYGEARLKIQGYEVPFMGARVNFGVNVPSTATIQIIPTKQAKAIRPGMKVFISYRDHYASMLTGYEIFRQLFEGEVMGWSYQRTEGGRAINLSAIDYANFLINANQYYLNFETTQFLGSSQIAVFAGVRKVQGQLLGTKGKLSSFFTQNKDESFDQVIKRILLDVANVNVYFNRNMNELSLAARIVSASTSEMAKAVFDSDFAVDFIKQQLNKSGGVQSLWKTVAMLLNIVHHEIISCPTPSVVPIRSYSKEQRAGVYWSQRDIADISTDLEKTMQKKHGTKSWVPGNFIVKPNAWMLEPPQCNIMYANEVTGLSYAVNYQNKITRLQLIPNSPIIKGKNRLNILQAVYQPNSLREYIRGNYGSLTTRVKAQNLREFDFLTNEELERGIVAGFSTILPGATAFLTSHSAKNIAKRKASSSGSGQVYTEDIQTFVSRLAEFEFYRKRAAANSFSVQGVFKPHIIAGHPMIFVDDTDMEMDVMAFVSGGAHIINASGHMNTQLNLELGRELSDEVPNLDKQAIKGGIPLLPSEPPLPAWFDTAYTHGKVGGQVYSKTLGCSGFLNVANNTQNDIAFSLAQNPTTSFPNGRVVGNAALQQQHLQEVRQKMVAAADGLRKKYRGAAAAGEHGLFAYQTTFRPIATEEQMLQTFYGGKLKGVRSLKYGLSYTGDIRTSRVEAEIYGNNTNKDRVPNTINLQSVDSRNATTANPPSSNSSSNQTNTPSSVNSTNTTTPSSTQNNSPSVLVQVKSTKSKSVLATNPGPPSLDVKTGANFLHFAAQYALGKPYVFGYPRSWVNPADPPTAFDCSGISWYTARQFGVQLNRRSIEMFQGLTSISVEEALKTPGALLFFFKNLDKPQKYWRKHVALSVGDNKTTLETLNPKSPCKYYRRGYAKYWTHAGLIPGFTYGNVTVQGTVNLVKTNFAAYHADFDRRRKLILSNHLRIASEYQQSLAALTAILG